MSGLVVRSLGWTCLSLLALAMAPGGVALAQPAAPDQQVDAPASAGHPSGGGASASGQRGVEEPRPGAVTLDAAHAAAEQVAAEAERSERRADSAEPDDATLLKERVALMRTHRILGLATWGVMTATVVLGAIQYYNLYGFFSPVESTPCVQGTAVFGQGQCSGTPWLHLTASLLTAGLYTATGLLAWRMPVPKGYAQGESRHARHVRLHRLLRWIHLGGMAAQMILGVVTANAQWFGLERANDYGTLRALATTHLAIGLVTWGALSWAGDLFL